MKESLSPRNMVEGMHYIAMKVNKRICSHKEYKIADYKAIRNVDWSRKQAINKCSHKKHKMVDLSI